MDMTLHDRAFSTLCCCFLLLDPSGFPDRSLVSSDVMSDCDYMSRPLDYHK